MIGKTNNSNINNNNNNIIDLSSAQSIHILCNECPIYIYIYNINIVIVFRSPEIIRQCKRVRRRVRIMKHTNMFGKGISCKYNNTLICVRASVQ